MNAPLLRELLDKYMAEMATEQECLQLQQLLQEAPYAEALGSMITNDMEAQRYNNEEDGAMKALLLQRITHAMHQNTAKRIPMPPPRSKKRLLPYVAAAAMLIILATTLLWYRWPFGGQQKQLAKTSIDIPPGHNGAILTLADGSTILLDSATNGTIAQQANTTITKTNGQLSYNNKSDIEKSDIEKSYNVLTTPPGRQFSIVLPDGSKVWLNAASSLRYPAAFAGNERVVELTGEAYFEIAANAALPFFVQSTGQQVQVLGTHFNINAYTNEPNTKTTLLEGSIRVTNPTSKNPTSKNLTPGQQSQLQEQYLTVQPADVAQAVAWKDGLFSFHHADLQAIMRQLSRWYNVEVQFEGNPGQEQFTGKIGRNLSLHDVMEGLAFTHVKYRIEEGKRIVVLP
jgi:ferric-dicitrate binding protein FerR (iron transport regulator)